MSTIAEKFSDQSNVFMNDFPSVVNGAVTSEDYLSVFTSNYNNSPYNQVNWIFGFSLSDENCDFTIDLNIEI